MQLEQILQHYWHHAMIDYSHPLLKQGTAFQQKVWQALCGIPTGQTRTYGELAQTQYPRYGLGASSGYHIIDCE
jgi:methylated-DNA-[protein]-cysteine S-methyltransferase